MHIMKFSIVTISYNQVRFLEHAIRSVIDQKGVEIEYIVVDPGSTDGSRDLLDQYRDRIDTLILAPDSGPADGLNNGFAVATGDVFGFLNADDELLPDALACVEDAFDKHPCADVISGCGYAVDEFGARLRPIVPTTLTPWLYAHGGVTVFQQGTFFKADYFRKAGGFNRDNRTCWDGELFLDMVLKGARFMTIGNDLASFRLHDASITGSGRLEQNYRIDTARLFEKALGRKQVQRDIFSAPLARCAKWFAEPAYLPRRLARLSFGR